MTKPTAEELALGFATEWQKPEPDMLFGDGDQYLVALQVQSRHKPGVYYWEYAVVTASCDSETPVSFSLDGEGWGWDWSDVEYFVPLSQFRLGVPLREANRFAAQSAELNRLRDELELATKVANDGLYWLRAAKCHEMAGDIEREWKKARAALAPNGAAK